MTMGEISRASLASALIVQFLLPVPSAAAELSFRGIRLGMTMNEFRKANHPDKIPGSLSACEGERVPGTLSLPAVKALPADRRAGIRVCAFYAPVEDMDNYYDEAPVIVGNDKPRLQHFEFASENQGDPPRLFNIWMTIKGRGQAPRLIEAYRKRFGDPIETTRVVHNRMGAKFSARTVIWIVGGGSITVREYSPDLVTHYVSYRHTKLFTLVSKRRSSQDKIGDRL